MLFLARKDQSHTIQRQSIKKFARTWRKSNCTMRGIVTEGLGLKSYVVRKWRWATNAEKNTGLPRCQTLLNWTKSISKLVRIFSDAKNFMIYTVANCHNTCFFGDPMSGCPLGGEISQNFKTSSIHNVLGGLLQGPVASPCFCGNWRENQYPAVPRELPGA